MAEKGSLELLLGSYEKARPALTEAVSIMEKETPLNLIDFPRTLLSLGVVEQANGNVEGAEKLAKRCLALYRHNTLPEDLTLGETYNLLGTCLALRGTKPRATPKKPYAMPSMPGISIRLSLIRNRWKWPAFMQLWPTSRRLEAITRKPTSWRKRS
jgi:tetratricopeptide (TPR) repeat protein